MTVRRGDEGRLEMAIKLTIGCASSKGTYVYKGKPRRQERKHEARMRQSSLMPSWELPSSWEPPVRWVPMEVSKSATS